MASEASSACVQLHARTLLKDEATPPSVSSLKAAAPVGTHAIHRHPTLILWKRHAVVGRQFLIQEAPVVVPDVPDLTIVLEEIREKPDDLFLHWEVSQTQMRQRIPKGLELDLYDGKAWIVASAFS